MSVVSKSSKIISSRASLRSEAKRVGDKEFGEFQSPDREPSLAGQNDPEKIRCQDMQDEFIRLLYDDMVQSLLKNWQVDRSEKSSDLRSDLSDSKLSPSRVEFPNRNTYEGNFSRRQMEGIGIYRWGSGETYKGQFEENSIQGKGHLEWNDQSWYEGEFRKSYRHGTGNLVSHGFGRFYIGQWHMGRKHGKGYCRYDRDDDYYDGEWNMGRRHGAGYRAYAGGARYAGRWENDRRHGVGTMVWPNGDVYRGDWKNGLMNGYGEYVWNGFFNKSLSWPRENCYMGEWLDGMKHGEGILKLNSVGGAKYVGDWQMDEKHGYGMIIGNSGAVTEADPLFLNNILTPLNTDATHLTKLELEELDSESEFADSASGIPAMKHKEPRKTTILEPLQFPSLWFHVRRLFRPRYQQLQCSRAPVILSGKCRVCRDDSACSCLEHHSAADEKSATESSSSHDKVDSLSSSSKFCIHPLDEEGTGIAKTKEQYEEHWVHNCLTKHMVELRKIYKLYAELYLGSDKGEIPLSDRLSMSKISLWQLMRDCEIHARGISLVELERRLAFNESAFVETAFYPFERIEFFQLVHALLEISWHLYTRLDDVETEAVRGRLAGGLHKLLVNDIIPKAGKHVGNVRKYRDILPIYSIYRLYRDVGEPHTARELLRATCIAEGSSDPEPLPLSGGNTSVFPSQRMYGKNVITVGEKLSYIPSGNSTVRSSPADQPERKCEDKLGKAIMSGMQRFEDKNSRSFMYKLYVSAGELFALRHIGAPKMVSVLAEVCPAIKDEETGMIINMDYELTFLEFYEVLLAATMEVIRARKVSKLESETPEAETNAVIAADSFPRSESIRSTRSEHRSLKTPKSEEKLIRGEGIPK